ncbi:HPP family-domain-containing protein [Sporodiniella umbellata]|nr:HPP family-domain-containing protein [Sporodiniella umbellata]
MSNLERLPYFISRFLGYRKPEYKRRILPLWRVILWSFLAAWIGIALLEVIFTYSPSFQEHHAPIIVASFGAGAVLVYGAIDAPLAQPRNVICGQTIGAIIGVIYAQLFLYIKQDWPSEGLRTLVIWIAGASSMATALVVMQLTKTIHPPAGATALIATTTASIMELKWFYIGIVLLSAVLQVTIGCLINNIERKYPVYWWTPESLPIIADPNNISTAISFKGHSIHDVLSVEEGASDQTKQESDSSPSITHPDVAHDLDRAISVINMYSIESLSHQDYKSLHSLLNKIASRVSNSAHN